METTDGLFSERARHGLWVLESVQCWIPGRWSPPAVSRQCPVRWVRCTQEDNGRPDGYVRVVGPRPLLNCPPLATFRLNGGNPPGSCLVPCFGDAAD